MNGWPPFPSNFNACKLASADFGVSAKNKTGTSPYFIDVKSSFISSLTTMTDNLGLPIFDKPGILLLNPQRTDKQKSAHQLAPLAHSTD